MWAAPLAGLFLLVDMPFFAANISKIFHGAWPPLVIGVVVFTLTLAWAKGRRILAGKLRKDMPPLHQFIVNLASHPPNKIEGDAVYLAGNKNVVPVVLAKNVKHNKVIHSRTVLMNFQVEDIPRVPSLEKIQTEKLGGGFHRIVARYGFMEEPSLGTLFSLAHDQGLDLDPGTTSFYVCRENLVIAGTSALMRWRANLFIFMSRNAAEATSFFTLPADQTIEVGVRLEI